MDFEGYGNLTEWGYLPHYTADIIGSFELTNRPESDGCCLRQVVSRRTNSWAPEWHYYTILGDSCWKDYEVSADVYLNAGDEGGVMGRICHVGTGYGIEAKGYYLKLDDKGQCTLVLTCGKKDPNALVGDAEQQALILSNHDESKGGEQVLKTVHIEGLQAYQWHNLSLRFDGDDIIGYVDSIEVIRYKSGTYSSGMAGLIVTLHESSVSTPYFDNLKILPIGRTTVVECIGKEIEPLYPKEWMAMIQVRRNGFIMFIM